MQSGLIEVMVLLAARFGALVVLAPPWSSSQIPAMVRVGFVTAMAISLSLCLPGAQIDKSLSLGELMACMFSELAIGLPLALGVAFAFAAYSAGGQLLDIQIGFGISQLFDPTTRQRLPVLATALGQLAMVSFFAVNGDHALLRAIALSLERYPLGHPFQIDVPLDALLMSGASMFALGFSIVAPVVFCLLLTEVGIGILGRNLPQINIFAVGLPIKVIVGLIGLATWFGMAVSIAQRFQNAILAGWMGWLN